MRVTECNDPADVKQAGSADAHSARQPRVSPLRRMTDDVAANFWHRPSIYAPELAAKRWESLNYNLSCGLQALKAGTN